jgi:hypothetical protein
MEELKLVFVQWLDITSTDSNWRNLEDATDWADDVDSVVRQTGFLVGKDDEFLTLTCSYVPGLELVGTTIRIPMSVVKEYKEISIEDFKK